ncbi:hypothetical protein ACROYT_G041202 [Oculina patagonica]
MRNAKNEDNERMFTRTEWLTKSQIQCFFSRLAAKRRKDQGVVEMSPDDEEDVQCLQENSDRQVLVDEVNREINVSHPICYDTYDLCERYHSNHRRPKLTIRLPLDVTLAYERCCVTKIRFRREN